MYSSIRLTEAEMALLDDGQKWYDPGDACDLGGEIPADAEEDSRKRLEWSLDLCVDGKTHDNWIAWHQLPESLRERLLAEADEE